MPSQPSPLRWPHSRRHTNVVLMELVRGRRCSQLPENSFMYVRPFLMLPSFVSPNAVPMGNPPSNTWLSVGLVRGEAWKTSVASKYGGCDVPSPPPRSSHS